jgi:hypothetical protein
MLIGWTEMQTSLYSGQPINIMPLWSATTPFVPDHLGITQMLPLPESTHPGSILPVIHSFSDG